MVLLREKKKKFRVYWKICDCWVQSSAQIESLNNCQIMDKIKKGISVGDSPLSRFCCSVQCWKLSGHHWRPTPCLSICDNFGWYYFRPDMINKFDLLQTQQNLFIQEINNDVLLHPYGLLTSLTINCQVLVKSYI